MQNKELCRKIKKYVRKHLAELSSEMLCEYLNNTNRVENDSEGYVDQLKTLLEKYGITKICPSTCYNWLCKLDSCTVPRRKAILWTGMVSPPQLPTGLLLFPATSNTREGHIGGSSSRHLKHLTCKKRER